MTRSTINSRSIEGIGSIDATGTVTAAGLTVDTDTLHIDSTNNRVGIGTSSPQQLLSLKANNPGGKIRLEMGQAGVANNDVTGEIQFYHNDASGAGVNADIKGICTSSVGAGALTFGTGTTSTTERMRITASGNVGIGTTSPNNFLQINGGAADTAFQITNSATGSTATDGFSITVENPTPDVVIRNREASNMRFLTSNTERMRIDSTGNVGIGTTSPSYKLTVEDGTGATRVNVRNTANAGPGSGIFFEVYSGGSVVGNGTIATQSSGDMAFFTGTSSGSERMRIESDGKIIIGNNIPMWSGQYGGALFLKGNNATGDRYAELTTVDSTGVSTGIGLVVKNTDVGIGTSSPSDKLDISGGVRVTSNTPNANVTGALLDYLPTGEGRLFAYRSAGGGLVFYTNPNGGTVSERMRIDSIGNVGIGTSSPSGAKLHVAGGLKATDLIAHDTTGINLQTSNGTKRLIVDNSGRVTMPYQPAFFAYNLNFPGSNAAGTASGGTVLVNVGSHYATGTGRFTAPIAGTYVFYMMTQAYDSGNTSGNYQTAIFQKNGSSVGAETYHGWAPPDGNNHVQSQNTIIITLAANDYMMAYVQYGSRDIQNYFGGYLLG